jgi:hypothetical protein
VPESARKSVATLCLHRTLEKKLIKNLFNTIQNMRENVFSGKLNETTQRTNTTDGSGKGKVDANRLAKGLVMLSETTKKKDLESMMFYKWKAHTFAQASSNMNTSAILGEYYKKHTHSPIPSSRGTISNLASKLPEKNSEYAQKQSIQFMHKVGIGIISKVVLVHITRTFCKLREADGMMRATEKCKKLLLKLLLNREVMEVKRNKMNTFHRWRTHSISDAFTKGRITNKVKGRMLLSLSKKQSSVSIETAFLRWKVRADPGILRKAIEKFALNTKLNPHLALWKMKAGAAQRKEKIDREQRSNYKLVKGFESIANVMQRYNLRQLSHALVNIDEYKFTLALRKKCVLMFRRFLQRGLVQAMEKWKQACIQKLLSDLRKKAIKGLAKAPNHLQIAFARWKHFSTHASSKIDKAKSINVVSFKNKLENVSKGMQRVAFDKLKSKVKKFKLTEQMTQNLVFRIQMRLKHALQTWKEQLFNSKLIKQKKVENINKIFEFMKMRRKLELQKAIYAVKTNQMSIEHKNHRLAMLVVHTMSTKIRNSMRIWQLKKDISKYMDISKKCNLLMSTLSKSMRQNTRLVFETETVNKQYVCLK